MAITGVFLASFMPIVLAAILEKIRSKLFSKIIFSPHLSFPLGINEKGNLLFLKLHHGLSSRNLTSH